MLGARACFVITTATWALASAACGSAPSKVASVKEMGTFPNPPRCTARDVGMSARLGDESVWIFGDTFFSEPAEDGFKVRSSTWSWTAAPNIGAVDHALGADGKPLQLLPNTADELAYNVAHRDEPRRHTPWPLAIVSNGDRAIVFYLNMVTGPNGGFDFASVSGSVATWSDRTLPATRIEPPIFSNEEPDWGAAALLVGSDVYAYACDGDLPKPCKLARVPFDTIGDRSRYSFWTGTEWSSDWRDAKTVFDGAPLFSVHWNDHLGAFIAIYMEPGGNEMRYRAAPKPEGPWTDAIAFGRGEAGSDGSSPYALIAHPELAREGGAVDVLSYTRTTGFLVQETRLVELRWR
jgi:Domain of unknown function (DUF4185)